MNVIREVRQALIDSIDQKAKDSFQRFFKEEVKYYGVRSAVVGKIAKDYYQKVKNESKEKIFALCEELLKSNYCEESWIAADWTYNLRKQFTIEEFAVFENWIDKYINNWATCDTFCNHTVGSLIEQYPNQIRTLKNWAKSKNLWLRRASAVSLIIPAKEGKFLKDIFEIANILLTDQADMVQKGYGWMLKEASRKHPQEVFDYVVKNKSVMPRTALRYAIEKMPRAMKIKAMAR